MIAQALTLAHQGACGDPLPSTRATSKAASPAALRRAANVFPAQRLCAMFCVPRRGHNANNS